jgi:hypothetical protein
VKICVREAKIHHGNGRRQSSRLLRPSPQPHPAVSSAAVDGTGTEEIFGGGACPNVEYASPYTGFHLVESPAFDGLIGMYRWYVADPIRFQHSLRWTLEHGHANNFGNGYASVAYWCQKPIAAEFPALPPREELLPPLDEAYPDLRDRFFAATRKAREGNVERELASLEP